LGYSRYDYKNKDTDNSRNGHSSKTLRTSFGDVEVSVPRDRKGEFDPQILKKNQTSISQDVEEKILAFEFSLRHLSLELYNSGKIFANNIICNRVVLP
ncbi:Transposase, Mutator family, partial [Ruminococcaceae bacterium P7]